MLIGFITSITSVLRSLPYLFKPRIFVYLVVSGLMSLAVFGLLSWAIYALGDDLGDGLLGLSPWEIKYDFITTGIEWITRLILFVLAVLVFKYIVLIITSPLMSLVSDSVEKYETGNSPKPVGSNLRGLARGLALSSRNITKELLYTLPMLVLSLIPGLAIIMTPIIFLIQAFYAGFGNIDFYMERRYNVKESKAYIKAHRGLAIGNGCIFLGLLLIPILGVFLAPTVATISGTLAAISLRQDQQLS